MKKWRSLPRSEPTFDQCYDSSANGRYVENRLSLPGRRGPSAGPATVRRRRRSEVGQEPPVEVDVQFGQSGSSPPSLKDRSPASELAGTLPRPDPHRPSDTWSVGRLLMNCNGYSLAALAGASSAIADVHRSAAVRLLNFVLL